MRDKEDIFVFQATDAIENGRVIGHFLIVLD